MNKNKSEIAKGIVLKFKTQGVEQNYDTETFGRFKWTREKAPFGRMTAHGWKGYIIRQGGKIAFKCNWLRDFKPAVRHLEQTFSGDKELSSEFYDIAKTGDIWGFNDRLFSKETIKTLENIIVKKVATLQDIPQRKESERDRTNRLLRAKKVLAKKIKLGLI